MISFFYPAAQDQALAYLSQLFGTMNGIIPSAQAAVGTGSITILSTMFKTFNTVVLAVGALIVVYVTIVGVMRTAHEGEFMGKHWSSLWLPIRMVLGIAALVPTGSGYCALQLLMMWVVVQGIGAADTLWGTAISYANLTGSPFAQINIPSVGVTNQLNGLFEGLVCDATYRYVPAQDADGKYMVGPKIRYYCQDHSCATSAPTFSPDTSSSYSLGPEGVCGALSYCNKATSCKDPNSIACQACTAQLQALASIIPVMQPIAQTVAQTDYAYQYFYYYSYDKNNTAVDYSFMNQYCADTNQSSCCVPRSGKHPADSCQPTNKKDDQTQFLDPSDQTRLNANDSVITSIIMPYVVLPQIKSYDFINTLTQYYTNTVAEAVQSQVIEQAQSQSSAGLSSDLQNAQNVGWILAGGYYYTLAKMNNNNQQSANQNFTFNPGVVATNFGGAGSNVTQGYRNNFNAANTLISAAASAASSDDNGQGSTPPQKPTSVDKSKDIVAQGATDMLNTFDTSISQQNTNPLATLQAAASGMFWTVSVLFAAFLAATFYAGVLSNIDIWVFGYGAIDPAGPAMSLAYFVLVPMLFGLMGIMVAYGALIGVYVPLIPYVVFSIGAVGWLISTIEMMVAGPLVALGILMPAGHHDILGKAEPAIMLLFNIFLRPSLMIFGLIAAMLLAGIVVNMINAAWHTVRTSIGSSKSVIGEICFLAAYIILVVTALNKAFSVIYVVPERVMSWISGQGAQYGEEAAMGEVRRGAESAGGKTEATFGAGRGSAESGVKGFQKARTGLARKESDEQNVTVSKGDGSGGGDTGGTA